MKFDYQFVHDYFEELCRNFINHATITGKLSDQQTDHLSPSFSHIQLVYTDMSTQSSDFAPFRCSMRRDFKDNIIYFTTMLDNTNITRGIYNLDDKIITQNHHQRMEHLDVFVLTSIIQTIAQRHHEDLQKLPILDLPAHLEIIHENEIATALKTAFIDFHDPTKLDTTNELQRNICVTKGNIDVDVYHSIEFGYDDIHVYIRYMVPPYNIHIYSYNIDLFADEIEFYGMKPKDFDTLFGQFILTLKLMQ